MAAKKPPRKLANPSAKKQLASAPKVLPSSKTFEFFKDVTIAPGHNHDSTTATNVDCYQWLHAWVLAKHAAGMAMDNIDVELVFELPGKMGAAGLANLELPYEVNVRPTPLRVNSGIPAGGYGGFVVRAPIIGPAVRAIVINKGAQIYDFTVWGYATH